MDKSESIHTCCVKWLPIPPMPLAVSHCQLMMLLIRGSRTMETQYYRTLQGSCKAPSALSWYYLCSGSVQFFLEPKFCFTCSVDPNFNNFPFQRFYYSFHCPCHLLDTLSFWQYQCPLETRLKWPGQMVIALCLSSIESHSSLFIRSVPDWQKLWGKQLGSLLLLYLE